MQALSAKPLPSWERERSAHIPPEGILQEIVRTASTNRTNKVLLSFWAAHPGCVQLHKFAECRNQTQHTWWIIYLSFSLKWNGIFSSRSMQLISNREQSFEPMPTSNFVDWNCCWPACRTREYVCKMCINKFKRWPDLGKPLFLRGCRTSSILQIVLKYELKAWLE